MNTISLRNEIRAFLKETGMGPSYFGRLAAGNGDLVARLESGRTVTLPTAERVRSFIADRRATKTKTKKGKHTDARR